MQRRVCLKRLWILLSALCLVGLSVRSAQAELKVVATLKQYGSIAKTIGGDRVKVSALVKGYQNPHAVEVKPSYSVLLNKADLLVANGQLIEVGWLDNALINARNLKVMEGESGFVDCSIGVDIIPYEAQEIEGQKQRTQIARGLATEPDMLILDEPTDGMDIAGEAGIMELMSEVRRQSGRTILMITHNLNVVANYAQHLMIIHGGEDLFIAGTTEELLSSQTLRDVYQLRLDVYVFAGRKFVFAQKASGTGMGERSWNF
jgi:Zinc-uptake complex component A periplasmic/ABC transporter